MTDNEKPKDEIVEFKSTPDNYENEKSGAKPNTLREVDDETDERFEKLFNGTAKRIRIKNTKTGEMFERKIMNITQPAFNPCLILISWDIEAQIRQDEREKLKQEQIEEFRKIPASKRSITEIIQLDYINEKDKKIKDLERELSECPEKTLNGLAEFFISERERKLKEGGINPDTEWSIETVKQAISAYKKAKELGNTEGKGVEKV